MPSSWMQGSSFEVTVNKVRRKHASKEHLSGHSFLRCRLPGYSVALVYLSLFRQITVYEDRASKTPGGDPDTQDANGSTDLSTRHLRWAEARLPLGAAGASSRTFVPAFFCCIIFLLYHNSGQTQSRCLGARCIGAWRSCGRPLVAVWREICLARKRKSARWVTEFYRVFAAPCESF